MTESLRSWLQRWAFNFFPAYRGTGARITYLSDDWREVRLRLPLNWRTRNYVGTIFGGSMYGAVDPIYMIMLIKNLGPDYIVWDKAATIRFQAPGRDTLYAHCLLSEEELSVIRFSLEAQPTMDRTYTIELTSDDGKVHAVVEKTIHIRRSGNTRAEQ